MGVSSTDAISDEEDYPTLNTVDDLRKGIIKTSKNKARAPYTILLVGETGVGKSSFFELIANVVIGNDVDHYDFDILKKENEQGDSKSQSQTSKAHLYEFESGNGITVRILDTPGLADTRGVQQDEIHKKNIATAIKESIDSVNAVIILANGTVPRLTVGTDYALSTLSAIFPKSLANNIGFLFTNVPSPLSWNFSEDSLPKVLRDAPQNLLDNPIALQKKYIELATDPKSRKILKDMRKAVKAGEAKALETLVDIFDWLDGLQPQPTNDILYLYDQSQAIMSKINNTLAQMDQAAVKRHTIRGLLNEIKKGESNMSAFSNYETTVSLPIWKHQDSDTYNTLCSQIQCHSNCHIRCTLNFSLDPRGIKGCLAMDGETCRQCSHSLWNHHHYYVKWVNVIDQQHSVDQEMKRKWEEAKSDKEKGEIMVAAIERTLDEFDSTIDTNTRDLAQLISDYANLSLSGSFVAQVEKTVSLLEQKLKGTQESGDLHDVEKVRVSLEEMKKKLDLLRKAKEKESGFITRVKRAVVLAFDYY